jgi:hypothetical protein
MHTHEYRDVKVRLRHLIYIGGGARTFFLKKNYHCRVDATINSADNGLYLRRMADTAQRERGDAGR